MLGQYAPPLTFDELLQRASIGVLASSIQPAPAQEGAERGEAGEEAGGLQGVENSRGIAVVSIGGRTEGEDGVGGRDLDRPEASIGVFLDNVVQPVWGRITVRVDGDGAEEEAVAVQTRGGVGLNVSGYIIT